MAAVDNGRSIFKSFPDTVSQFFCHRSDVAEFLMKFLQLVESGDRVIGFCQLFGSFTQISFLFQVFLEVVFSEFIVQLHHVIELLGIVLVVFPQFIGLVCRYQFNVVPFLLQLLELIVYAVGISLIFGQFLHSLQNGEFFLKVFFLYLLLFSSNTVSFFFDLCHYFFHGSFKWLCFHCVVFGSASGFYIRLICRILFGMQHFIERLFQ